MRLAVDLEDVAGVDVGVPLGRREAGVAQKLLNGAEIGPALQEVGREAVAHRVGADTPGQGHLPDAGRDDLADAAGRSWLDCRERRCLTL